ncbi:uncharacterized protein H6S33_001930 [Morchella sextelata]|uniref:uncharacterized protein n=1 Tax=Morchella sextelata TaxID=1174677 RepID=UPI001D051540|nr:uncharacterized protein H6S33_001930 [Morchella sextelata]KAH0607878.1 hypothetical protein H6S33_001930 [Morchella sextelata]
MARSSFETEVRSWGFKEVFTWTDSPNYHYPPHKHNALTTHLIVSGQLTIRYPEDSQAPDKKETFGPGGRIDVGKGVVHEVWIGDEGCTYVIGE